MSSTPAAMDVASPSLRSSRAWLALLVTLAGTAALSWETLWQLLASLALGASSYGTAITLATTMAGMAVGALASGVLLRQRLRQSPLRTYAVLELVIGISGLLLVPLFHVVAAVDTAVYRLSPQLGPWLHLVAIALVLGLPTLMMGATLPVLGLVASRLRTSLSVLYGLNTLGAAAGALLVALLAIPALGVRGATIAIAAVNGAVCIGLLVLDHRSAASERPEASVPDRRGGGGESGQAGWWLFVFATGFATFGLEVSWFRAFRATFYSTTDVFAVMLASVLLALGLAARLVPRLRSRLRSPAPLMATGGIWVIATTPLVERLDVIMLQHLNPPVLGWLVMTFVIIGPPVLAIGVVLPWLLDTAAHTRSWAGLYAVNTLGAVLGAVVSAWLLLPALGFARTSWLLGTVVAFPALFKGRYCGRRWLAVVWAAVLVVAVILEADLGRRRIQGDLLTLEYEILAYDEGPDATVAAVKLANGYRALIIDGFQAASERRNAHYMEWMGRLPTLLHEEPRDVLVICFGSGQTTNGVRQEGAERIDVVDLNRAVFEMAGHFPANGGVLEDRRVHRVVMDGRAYLRRTDRSYDVITLEPMPPNFAGVNALYSQEFYLNARQRLRPGGIMAQWLPIHLVTPVTSASITATFEAVFPGSIVWLDPVSPTGILLGRKGRPVIGGGPSPAGEWPGFERTSPRDLSSDAVLDAILLSGSALRQYAACGRIISDDNQFLAYGPEAMAPWRRRSDLLGPNLESLSRFGTKVIRSALPRQAR